MQSEFGITQGTIVEDYKAGHSGQARLSGLSERAGPWENVGHYQLKVKKGLKGHRDKNNIRLLIKNKVGNQGGMFFLLRLLIENKVF